MASNTIIQCTSSSSHLIRTYDVFVSFRGEDTRNNFTGFLFEALHRKGIDAFKDNIDLKKGESIAPELLQAIEGSRIFIVVFSKNYASSTWCLRELVEICNCIETSQRCVLPIFYDIDPSEVRKQSGYYEKAFAEHEGRFKEDKEMMEEVQRWREALKQVADLSGWDIRNKPQCVQIEEIVKKIINILGHKFSSLLNDDLIGMESRVEELAKRLRLWSVGDDVRVVGISGMGGIGKSTLAHALYERFSHQYDFCCFIDDVAKTYRDSGALGVLKQLLSQCLNDKNLEIWNVTEGTCLAWTRLRYRRALIVFDNVDEVGQLNMFVGRRDSLLHKCLGGGSKIIIVSRDKHICSAHGVDDVYQVQPLNNKDVVQLFCRNAFKDNDMSDYKELTYAVVSHAQGHPLAIEVLGSSLFGRNVLQWRSALARLRENKSRNIVNVLRLSFDELDDVDKEIFLDIACFFNYHEEKYVKKILHFRGFHPEYGLGVLVDKSLITIESGVIEMHGLLEDLGKCIVREKSPKEPRKWSRLWDYQDLHKVMSDNKTTKNLEAIVVKHRPKGFQGTTMRVDALSKLSHLKLLKLHDVNFSGSLNYLSNELGYLTWYKYPFECLPPSFQPNKLVEVCLPGSNIKQLWEGTKNQKKAQVSLLIFSLTIGSSLQSLHNLRRLDLSYSKNLIEMPNLREALNLERLNLEGCIQLRQIDPSIGLLQKLTKLNLRDCKSIIKLPHFGEAHNLVRLTMEGCLQLRQIDPSIGLLKNLTVLNVKDCKNLVSLPSSIVSLNSLEYLSLSGCSKLNIVEAPTHSQSTSSFVNSWFMRLLPFSYSSAHKDSVNCLFHSLPIYPCMRQLHLNFCNLLSIPDAIGKLHSLEILNLSGNSFATLPNLKELSKLFRLNMSHCKQLKYLPELPSRTDLMLQSYKQWNPYRYSSDESRPGLFIFNCPELVERECCTSKSLSWMKQIIVQGDYQCERIVHVPVRPIINIILPGSEIPLWINNQHVGSSISKDASPLMQLENNWTGFACCAIFVARHERGTDLAVGPPETKLVFPLHFPVFLNKDLVTYESDHMWLFYFTRSQLHDTYNILDISDLGDSKLEFEIKNKEGFHFEVKKYRHRWVYEQDLELPN